jgi:hypothetical protein
MAQPNFVPIRSEENVSEIQKLEPPKRWTPNRPADFNGKPEAVKKKYYGNPGPDSGYAMLLFESLKPDIKLEKGEDIHDVAAGVVYVAMKRAALFGRAPIKKDIEYVLKKFGFLDKAHSSQIEERKFLFKSAGHEYHKRMEIADKFSEEELKHQS